MVAARRLIGLVLSLMGCQGPCSGRAPPAAEGPTLVLGTLSEPDSLDPLFSQVSGANEIVRLLFRDLTRFDDQGRISPDLAESVPTASTSTGGEMVVKWRLKEHLRWSDGQPLTADDVVFGHAIETDPHLLVRSQALALEVKSLVSEGPRALSVTWRHPFVDFAAPQVHPILPAHAYPRPRGEGAPFAGLGRSPVSSGPYRLREWEPGRQLILEASPTWSGPQPKIPRLVWRFFQSEDAFLAALATGEIDALGEGSGLSPDRARSLGDRLSQTHVLHVTDSGAWAQLTVRMDHPITASLAVRQAIDRAIDRSALVELALDGAGVPAWGCLPPKHLAHRDLRPRPLDLASAAVLLDAAGWKQSGEGVRRRDGTPLRLQLLSASGSDSSARAAAYLQSQLAKIGIELELSTAPLGTIFERMRKGTHPPLVLYALRLRPDWDLVSTFKGGAPANYARVKDRVLDEALSKAMSTSDRGQWIAAIRAAEARLIEELPAIPLWFRGSASLRPRRLKGWRPTGTTTPVTWNAEEWELEDTPDP